MNEQRMGEPLKKKYPQVCLEEMCYIKNNLRVCIFPVPTSFIMRTILY